ncbi:hypothetical protein Dsin_032277 [Dipteronia sinensis]|uniref:Uncharacterized protein n=1 Tax=Dipteronia sinensis TaxID=43782 RepID=A0AAD9ZMX1_9ROSI|nr:hypothetical protein Dsin_032277 [Dipteronia sinensis]
MVSKKRKFMLLIGIRCAKARDVGLGIGRMGDKNKSLLAKWVWRFGTENNSLWRRVICARYGVSLSDLTWEWKGFSLASLFVKAVASLFVKEFASNRVLKEGLKVILCDGSRGKFWEITVGDSLQLKDVCPKIYALAIQN